MLKKLIRFQRVAAFNRDWHKYLKPNGSVADDAIEVFHLRNGQVVEVRKDARFVLNEIYLDRVYDIQGVNYSNLDHILDLGANVGLYATFIASQNPNATIYCFEPAQENFQILGRNISRNNVNARLYQSAVSLNDGSGFLSQKNSSVEYALVDEPDSFTEEVRCVSLNNIFSVCGVERFDLIKIDIEGHEKTLLENASDEWLTRFNNMIIEWHHSWEIMETLAQRLRTLGFAAEPMLIEGHMRFLSARQI